MSAHRRGVESQNTLKQHNVHLRGVDDGELVGQPAVGLEVVDGYPGGPPQGDVPQALFHQSVVEGVRMVEIKETLGRPTKFSPLQVPVEGVLRDMNHLKN